MTTLPMVNGERDLKQSGQRQLGLGAQIPSHPYVTQPQLPVQAQPSPQGQPSYQAIQAQIRPAHPLVTSSGPIYMDQQGRPVQLTANGLQPIPRPMSQGQITHPQFMNMTPLQQQQFLSHHYLQQQQAHTQALQQAQQQHPQHPQHPAQYQARPHPFPPHHPQHLLQQHLRQQQSTPVPGHLLPNNIPPNALYAQPASLTMGTPSTWPPQPRNSTSASPAPMSQQVQTTSSSAGMRIHPPSQVSHTVQAIQRLSQDTPTDNKAQQSDTLQENQGGPSQVPSETKIDKDEDDTGKQRKITEGQIVGGKEEVRTQVLPIRLGDSASKSTQERRKQTEIERLEIVIQQAQSQLDEALKKVTEGSTLASPQVTAAGVRGKLERHILEYLEKAGYLEAASRLKEEIQRFKEVIQVEEAGQSPHTSPARDHLDKGADSAEEVVMEVQTPDTPRQTSNDPRIASTSERGNGSSSISSPVKSPEKDSAKAAEGLRITGHEDESMSTSPLPMTGAMEKLKTPLRTQSKRPEGRSRNTTHDLGYLHTWYTVFEGTVAVSKAHMLRSEGESLVVGNLPSAALRPTSALAARISMSAPADAVRATLPNRDSGKEGGGKLQNDGILRGDSALSGRGRSASTVTAQLQAADALRQAQQAQIDAMNGIETDKSRPGSTHTSVQQLVMNQNGQAITLSMPNGARMQMTPKTAQQHLLSQNHIRAQVRAQAQLGLQSAHLVQTESPPDSISLHSTSKGKRSANDLSLETPSKKAKMLSKTPTPEDHQRLALEIASRATGMQSPATFAGIKAPIQRPQSQPNQRKLSDAEQRYAQQQAAYAQRFLGPQVASMGIPSNPNDGPVPPFTFRHNPSPTTFTSANGNDADVEEDKKGQIHSQLEIGGWPTDGPTSAGPESTLSSGKRKVTGKKPGPKVGSKRGGRGGGRGGGNGNRSARQDEDRGTTTPPSSGYQLPARTPSSGVSMTQRSDGTWVIPPTSANVDASPHPMFSGQPYQSHSHVTMPQTPQQNGLMLGLNGMPFNPPETAGVGYPHQVTMQHPPDQGGSQFTHPSPIGQQGPTVVQPNSQLNSYGHGPQYARRQEMVASSNPSSVPSQGVISASSSSASHASHHDSSTSGSKGEARPPGAGNEVGDSPEEQFDNLMRALEGSSDGSILGDRGQQPLPANGMGGMQEMDSSFDFDWSTANFSGDDQNNNDWGLPDSAVTDGN